MANSRERWRDVGYGSIACGDYASAVDAFAQAGETKLLYNLGTFLIAKTDDVDLARKAYKLALNSEQEDVLKTELEQLMEQEYKVQNNGRDPKTLTRLNTLIEVIVDIIRGRWESEKEAS